MNSISVNAFFWLSEEFGQLVGLLSRPPSTRPTTAGFEAAHGLSLGKFHVQLDRLRVHLDIAYDLAVDGRDRGKNLIAELSAAQSGLQKEHDSFPGWRSTVDATRRFFIGGDPSKLKVLSQDLELMGNTISGIKDTAAVLNALRGDLKAFKAQLHSFQGSLRGVHLGASRAMGLGPEEEIALLSGVVDELAAAVGRARRGPEHRARRLGPGGEVYT